jgi:NAD+ diphosphatase
LALTHIFAGNPLDRADQQRRDPAWLDAAWRAPATRILPLSNLNVLVDGRTDTRLCWLSPEQVAPLQVNVEPVFLGLQAGVAHFALDISEVGDPAHALELGDGIGFQDARMSAMALGGPETGIVAQARAQVGWHRSHRHCSACGAVTAPARGGHVRQCGACKAEHFPRTDPVAIMLVLDGERCLLGQSAGPLARTGMFSALAGFIDQGESIEEAVRREVKEEAGVDVGDVRYHSSQPWPFPSSLMIGCHGTALSTDITIDGEEMVAVKWFERGDVREAMAGRHPTLKLPGALAIAHHLIRAWVDGEVR